MKVEIIGRKKKIFNLILKFTTINFKSVKIAKNSSFGPNVIIGKGTRINGPIRVSGKNCVIISKYCALGHGVTIISSNHDMNLLNLQVYLQKKITKLDYLVPSKKGVHIGNNVWIGDGAIILSGVSIGDGSIIGAHSVVTRDVPNYSIYAGNPAKLIRKRFHSSIEEKLDKLKFWEWDETKMIKHKKIFLARDEDFVSELNKIIV